MYEAHIPMPLIRTGKNSEIRVYAEIRSHQTANDGATCDLSIREIGSLPKRFGEKAIPKSTVDRAVSSLLEHGYLVAHKGGLRCTSPDGEQLLDAFYDCSEMIGFRTSYERPTSGTAAPEPSHPRDEGVPPTGRNRPTSGTADACSIRAQHPQHPLFTPTSPPKRNANLDGNGASNHEPEGGGDGEKDLVRKLEDRGITRSNPSAPWDAERIVRPFKAARLLRQIRHFDFEASQGRHHTGGWLIQAIVNDFPLPPGMAGARASPRIRGDPLPAQPTPEEQRLSQHEIRSVWTAQIESQSNA